MKNPLAIDGQKFKVSFQNKPPRAVRWGYHPSPYGDLMIGMTPEGAVCRVEFGKGRKAAAIVTAMKKEWPKTEFTEDKAGTAKVMAGLLKKGALPKLEVVGTKFQQDVWKTMLTLPVGKTLTYAEVAKKIKRPKAVRAVGTACGANPVAILVPCHRIVGSNGGLGGFGGGLPLKRQMLDIEGVKSKKAA